MLVIDYDGSSVGSALLAAVNEANRPRTNPTYIIVTAESHNVQEVERAVFVGKYWGAIFSTANATARLDAAIQGANSSEYVADDAYVLVGNSARYTAFYSEIVTENLESVADSAKTYYMQHNIASFLSESLVNETTLSSLQIQTILNPVGYTSIDTSYGPFTFGNRTLLNTLMIVVVVLCQFFFLMSLNGLSMAFGLFKGVSRMNYFKTRLPISTAWAIFAGLFVTSWQMTFKESYPINAQLFFSLWTLYTVFSVIIFDVLDIVTAFVPAQYIPFCMFTWMITNVTSAGSPPELSNVFFRVSYFFPARAMWFAEQHIWSQGGAYDLSLSLPILAAWLVVAKVGTLFTVDPRRKAAAAGAPRGKR
ncbi:uncharacterized protein N7483_004838 [Penicillium malachiteum]|uniref:uncharacterized protein n=1 Tax=Penicillium malachiteum TaxID=1324776 RepID=UPI002549904D|nr:uncharacterized protein N7483_004838 [Penicillium malachiteum]KAJ5730330.1 hypothetical protein N7483_004838 [Penicillium malachiteum]